MDGFSVVFLTIFVWIFSLCVALVGAHKTPKFSALYSRKRNVLLVIAHPDDESM